MPRLLSQRQTFMSEIYQLLIFVQAEGRPATTTVSATPEEARTMRHWISVVGDYLYIAERVTIGGRLVDTQFVIAISPATTKDPE